MTTQQEKAQEQSTEQENVELQQPEAVEEQVQSENREVGGYQAIIYKIKIINLSKI